MPLYFDCHLHNPTNSTLKLFMEYGTQIIIIISLNYPLSTIISFYFDCHLHDPTNSTLKLFMEYGTQIIIIIALNYPLSTIISFYFDCHLHNPTISTRCPLWFTIILDRVDMLNYLKC